MRDDVAGPDGSAFTEGLGPLPARWYSVDRDGAATLCVDEADARDVAAGCETMYPRGSPHRAVMLGDVAAERERCARSAETLTIQPDETVTAFSQRLAGCIRGA